jgi:hypothetical protein
MASKFAAMALAVDTPARCYLLHPVTGQRITGDDGDAAWIDLYSADSLVAKQALRVMYDRRIAAKARVMTPDESEAEAVEYLAALTAGWFLRGLDGAALDIPFVREDAAELYGWRGNRWLRDQVDRFVADRGNFHRT